jgi:hypothetical protein
MHHGPGPLQGTEQQLHGVRLAGVDLELERRLAEIVDAGQAAGQIATFDGNSQVPAPRAPDKLGDLGIGVGPVGA